MNGNKGKVYLFQHIKTKLNEEEKKLDDMMKKLRTKFRRVEQTYSENGIAHVTKNKLTSED